MSWCFANGSNKSNALQYFLLQLGDCNMIDNLKPLAKLLLNFRKYCYVITTYIVVVLFPLYCILKYIQNHRTYEIQYGWSISLGFMYGMLSAVLVVVFVLVLYCICSKSHGVLLSPEIVKSTAIFKFVYSNQQIVQISLSLLVNLFVVAIMNGLYILALLNYSSIVQTFALILLVSFKIIWNNSVILPVLESLQCPFRMITLVILCNNVILPMIATSFVDIDCFQSIFASLSPLNTNYVISFNTCTGYWANTTCATYGVIDYLVSTSISPAFVYSGQCSSALLRNYVPIYLLTFGLTGIFVPILQFYVLWTFRDNAYLPLIKKCKSNLNYYDIFTLGIISTLTLPIDKSDFSTFVTLIAIRNTNSIDTNNRKIVRMFYSIGRLSISYVTQVFLLVTFGIGYPPLAIILMISITLQTIILQISIHYHYNQAIQHADLYKAWSKVLDIETNGLNKQLTRTLSLSIILSSLFILVFILDMTWNHHTTNTFILLPLLFMIMTGVIIFIRPTAYAINNSNWGTWRSVLTWNMKFIELVTLRMNVIDIQDENEKKNNDVNRIQTTSAVSDVSCVHIINPLQDNLNGNIEVNESVER